MTLERLSIFGDGQSPHVIRWIIEMQKRGITVSLVTNHRSKDINCEQLCLAEFNNKSHWTKKVRLIQRHVAEFSPDIIHAHYITTYGYWALASLARPLVLSAWGSDVFLRSEQSVFVRMLNKLTLRTANMVFADSYSLQNAVQKLAPNARTALVFWGVDFDVYQLPPPKSNDQIRLVSIRNHEPLYRIDVIIKALRIVRSKSPLEVILAIAGSGSETKNLMALSRSLGVEDSVEWLARLGDEQLRDLLYSSHIGVSIPYSDATSMSVLEYMAAELPVIASNLPANRQWITEDGGLLIDDCTPHALAEAILSILNSHKNREQMGSRNRQFCRDHANRSSEIEKAIRIYLQLIGD